jgi:hypothetical protein
MTDHKKQVSCNAHATNMDKQYLDVPAIELLDPKQSFVSIKRPDMQ